MGALAALRAAMALTWLATEVATAEQKTAALQQADAHQAALLAFLKPPPRRGMKGFAAQPVEEGSADRDADCRRGRRSGRRRRGAAAARTRAAPTPAKDESRLSETPLCQRRNVPSSAAGGVAQYRPGKQASARREQDAVRRRAVREHFSPTGALRWVIDSVCARYFVCHGPTLPVGDSVGRVRPPACPPRGATYAVSGSSLWKRLGATMMTRAQIVCDAERITPADKALASRVKAAFFRMVTYAASWKAAREGARLRVTPEDLAVYGTGATGRLREVHVHWHAQRQRFASKFTAEMACGLGRRTVDSKVVVVMWGAAVTGGGAVR